MQKFVQSVLNRLIPGRRKAKVASSADYWERRYAAAGTSGAGSYGRLADFKAEVLNRFVAENDVGSVIEFGCGDGNQLRLARYPAYLGLDVAQRSIDLCQKVFEGDATKRFARYTVPITETADLTLSLDVIYHLVEDQVFDRYMHNLFDSALRFVIVYSSNRDEAEAPAKAAHVRHRKFTDWVDRAQAGRWQHIQHIPNRYPYDPKRGHDTSFADFHIFARPAAVI